MNAHAAADLAPPESAIPSATELRVSGMSCQGCVRHVTTALQTVPGVASASVELEASQARVLWQPGKPRDAKSLVEAVTRAGYRAEVLETAPPARPRWSPLAGWEFNVVAGSAVTIPLMVLEWFLRVGGQRWYHWLAFALVLPVQTLCGARFYRGAWNQLKVGSSNMDTLVALGSSAAFAFSAWGVFTGWPGHLFFMESAAIITLISVGHWIESKVSTRAASSLRALLNLAPPRARLLANGVEREVPVAQLCEGDNILLKPGDRVPTDAEVVEGASAVDESMLTGESMPVDKTAGTTIFAGTVNQDGRLLARVMATGEATALAQIIAVVQRAQGSRAKIQKLGDQVSSVFVPVVVVIALATGLWWGFAPESARAASAWLEPWLWPAHHPQGALAAAVYHAAAVLIIACPCAMGLATPVAIMAGTNVAAERGILIRDGEALEKSGRITAVIFDKTGTLTEGKLSVAATQSFENASTGSASAGPIAASLAKPSLHPLSQAVAASAQPAFVVADWREVRGSGVEGKLAELSTTWPGATFRLGSLAWLRELGVDPGPASAFASEWSNKGATILGLSADKQLLGVFALRDVLKPAAKEVSRTLQQQGKQVYLLTGDNAVTAQAIAEQAAVPAENVFAEIRPESKADIIRQLQARGERLAFVGDGINDAPALEQADLGIAVSRASDVAREAADIILLKSDIHAVPEALALAQATLRTIKQNLFWAFFYNAAGVPLAMLGFMSPVLSALAMGFSDLIVIGNALRLRRWRRNA